MTPAEEARLALDLGVSRSDLSPSAQIEYDKLLAAREAGTPTQAKAASTGMQESNQLVGADQLAKDQVDAGEGSASESHRRHHLRRTALLSALGTLVVVNAGRS